MHFIFRYLFFYKIPISSINPLSANVGYTPHEDDVTCSRCGILLKMASVFLKEEKILL